MGQHITASQNMHLLVFLPENAISTPENVIFWVFKGSFRSSFQGNMQSLKRGKTLASPTESKLSWR